MAQSDNLKRYLDAGMAFTQMTRERAEAIVQEFVDAGEIRRKEAQKRIEELLERSQKNTEELLNLVRREVAEQIRNLGLEDLAKRVGVDVPAAPASKSPAATPSTPKAAAPAKKVAAKKASTAKKPAAKKSPAKKATTKAAKQA